MLLSLTDIDFAILDWIQKVFRCEALDSAMLTITTLCNAGVFWILLTIFLLSDRRTRVDAGALACALVVHLLVVNVLLKNLVYRERPYISRPDILMLITPTDSSFPSGHTAACFACVAALVDRKSKMWIPALILSILIAFSRLYLYVHFPSDVLAGAVIGYLCGMAGAFLYRKFRAKSWRKKPSPAR